MTKFSGIPASSKREMLVFRTEWLESFLPQAYRPSFLAAFGKNWPSWFLPRGDTLYQVDLVRQALWFMARKKGEVGVFASSGRWLSKILKYRTGHCSVSVGNIFGLKCRWCEPSNPWRVLLPLSASQTKIYLPVSGSICSSKSPQQSFRLSSLALNPKWSEKNHHNVRWSASGLWQPKAPLSNNFSSSSPVNSRQAFGLFPQDFFFWRPILLWNDKTRRL